MKWFRRSSLIYYREGPEWWERIRLFISKRLLDLAENLPEVKAGPLHHLQYIRQQQRKDSDRNYTDYQIPEETRILLLGFQLIELFHIEDFERLRKTLIALFPDSHRLNPRDFVGFQGEISYGGWERHGYLVPPSSSLFLPADQKAIIEKLSSSIAYIDLLSHKVTPSLIALTMYIRLSDDVQDEFTEFFRKRYLYPTKLGRYRIKHDILPHSGTGFLNSGAEIKFRNWSEGLQHNVESAIRDYFPGYFNREIAGKVKLPRIDLFVIDESQVDESNVNEENHAKESTRTFWKRSLGLDEFPGFIDADDNTRWNFSERNRRNSWPVRMIIDFSAFTKDKNMSGYSNEENYIWHRVVEWLNEMNLPHSLAEYFRVERDKIAKVRQSVFQQKNLRMQLNARRLMRLLAEVQSNFIVLDRLLMEYDLVEQYLKKVLKRQAKSLVVEYDDAWTLKDAFSRILANQQKELEKHSDFLQATLNQIVNFVNLRETRKLTLFSIILSFLSIVIAIIALRIEWSP